MCWNVMMAVSVCGDHASNVLTIRGGWGPKMLPPDWTRAHPAVLWLVSSWPRGHTWTRGTGDLVLTAARNVTLCRDIFISSIQWWHSPDIGNIANTLLIVLTPRVPHTGSISPHCSPGSGFILATAHWHQFLPAPIIRSIKMFKARSKARDRVWLKWSVLRQLTQKPHLTSSSPSLFGHDTFFHLYQTKILK